MTAVEYPGSADGDISTVKQLLYFVVTSSNVALRCICSFFFQNVFIIKHKIPNSLDHTFWELLETAVTFLQTPLSKYETSQT